MKRSTPPLVLASLGLALLPGVSLAGPNANAKILLHLATPVTKNACINSRIPTCNGVVTNGLLNPTGYFAYLLVADGNATAGVGGMQCGVTYPGGVGPGGNSPINIYSWTLCASLEFTSTGWPASGGGNLITWDTATKCQRFEPGGAGTGVMAAAGYFYLAAYAAGTMTVAPRPVDGKAKVADCSSNEDLIGGVGFPGGVPLHLGSVRFSTGGNLYGDNPCGEAHIYCQIQGPNEVVAGQAGIVYSVGPGEATAEGSWSATGNAVIDQSDNTTATLHATGPGTFQIGYRVSSVGCLPEGCPGCGLTVSVLAPTAVEPSSWSRIKAMYPGSR